MIVGVVRCAFIARGSGVKAVVGHGSDGQPRHGLRSKSMLESDENFERDNTFFDFLAHKMVARSETGWLVCGGCRGMCYMVAVGGSEEGVDMVMVVRICVWCFAILGVDEPASDRSLPFYLLFWIINHA